MKTQVIWKTYACGHRATELVVASDSVKAGIETYRAQAEASRTNCPECAERIARRYPAQPESFAPYRPTHLSRIENNEARIGFVVGLLSIGAFAWAASKLLVGWFGH